MCADAEQWLPRSSNVPRPGDKGKNGDGKVNNSQVAISLAASFLLFSERERAELADAGGAHEEEERVRRETERDGRRRGRAKKRAL